MSECNFCSLKMIKARCPTGHRVRVVPAKDSGLGGFNVYRYCAGETIDHKKHFVAWFMALPGKCDC